ncbi:MAG: hypothetical protein KKG33_15080 [candidate division Zixibacteria bacterium]|nr:hypothetical protein [candidate division Zixibacteria bacterium]MBU1470489.1 hypothetical protein [candidate division Zixibacteria bacterium]MBU2626875.1 hypothetical protein [candidate division Zixibacteria bacterium]
MEETKPKETTPETEPIIAWSIHPAKQRLWVTAAVIVFILIIAIGIYSWTVSALFTALATMILIGSLSGYFFPTSYKFYDDQVVVKYTITSIKKEWSQYRSYYKDKSGVLLSPFTQRSRLENFRGIYIRFGDCDRERVMEFIKCKVESDDNGTR